MKKTYNFANGTWNTEDLEYAYSPACFDRAAFRQEEDCIVNGVGKSLFGY